MKYLFCLVVLVFSVPLSAQQVVKEYVVPLAQQGVAVDKNFFYVVNNKSITKHNKKDGSKVAAWEDQDSRLKHMNAGIVIDGKLYCTHSNFPETPMVSSVEIFDPVKLVHTGNHSFGILNGSATWIDKYKDCWYVVFAHYSGNGGIEGRDNSWTRLVKFDRDFRQLESWTFPKELLGKFGNLSCSGGVILPDGKILCTGHDEAEIYKLGFPEKGSTLVLLETIQVGSYGQGIAWEKSGGADLIYGLIRKQKKVVVSRIN
jgi:hypothetical protein